MRCGYRGLTLLAVLAMQCGQALANMPTEYVKDRWKEPTPYGNWVYETHCVTSPYSYCWLIKDFENFPETPENGRATYGVEVTPPEIGNYSRDGVRQGSAQSDDLTGNH